MRKKSNSKKWKIKTNTYKTEDKLIIDASGEDYDKLVTNHWNLNDSIEENN